MESTPTTPNFCLLFVIFVYLYSFSCMLDALCSWFSYPNTEKLNSTEQYGIPEVNHFDIIKGKRDNHFKSIKYIGNYEKAMQNFRLFVIYLEKHPKMRIKIAPLVSA